MKIVGTSVTEDELALLKDRAIKAGLSVSALIREGLKLPRARRMGRPGEPIACPRCHEIISMTSFVAHTKEHMKADRSARQRERRKHA
jgi:hypothetical protein